MSNAGQAWARRQRGVTGTTKYLLEVLGDYCNPAWPFAWSSVSTLAEDLGCSERQVKRLLRKLEEEALIVGFDVTDARTGRCRTRLYWLPVETARPAQKDVRAWENLTGGRVTYVSPSEGDMGVTGEGDIDVMGRVTPMSPLELELELRGSDEPTQSAGERAGEAWSAMPDGSRLGVSSPDLFDRAWAQQVADGADAAAMEAGCRAYGRTKAAWGVSGTPVAAHRFIAEGRWKSFAGSTSAAGLSGGEASMPQFAGPAAVWAAFAEAKGEAWCRSWLSPCRWDEGERALIAPKRLTVERIEQAGVKLRDLNIRIIAPSAHLEGTRA